MSVQVLEDRETGYQLMYCSTTMWAFGPIFYDDEDVEEFLGWLPKYPRTYSDTELEIKVSEWRSISEESQEYCSKCRAFVEFNERNDAMEKGDTFTVHVCPKCGTETINPEDQP